MRPNYTALPFVFTLLVFILASLLGAASNLDWDRCAAFDFDFDFYTLHNVGGNRAPRGLWSDGTTLWLADGYDAKIYAYNLLYKHRAISRDFDTLSAAGNDNPTGLWSDGTTMWVADWDDHKIYAYDLTTKDRDVSKDFDTLSAAGNDNPTGLWSDGTTMWVVDEYDVRIYAYDLTTKERDISKDFDTLSAAGNDNLFGLWSDGTTMWVVDRGDYKIYAYDLVTKARAASRDLDMLSTAENNNPGGLWSDGTTLWVADLFLEKIYAYCPKGTPTFTNTVADQTWTVGTAITPLTLPAATGGTVPYTYTLDPVPKGLIFFDRTRTLAGTPSAATDTATTHTYTVTDSTPVTALTASLTITITVSDAETTFGIGSQGAAVHVYPNPAGDVLHIEFPGPDEYGIALLTLTGQLILGERRSGGGTRTLDLSSLTKGVYVLKVEGREGVSYTFRIIR